MWVTEATKTPNVSRSKTALEWSTRTSCCLINIGVEGLDIDHFCLAQNIERASQNDGIFFRSDYRTVDIGALSSRRKGFV